VGVAAVLAVCSATACVRAYKPPSASDPHAVLKFRRVYETTAGTNLDERCTINGNEALSTHVASDIARAPRADAILVHPMPARVALEGAFSHLELRTVTELYMEQVPYSTTESYSCGSGTSYQMCSRMVTRTRSEIRYRTVTKNVPVTDGSCSQAVLLAPAIDHVYLLDFTYRGAGVCSATCLEQVGLAPDGSFTTQPCPPPTPEQLQDLKH
jgi:hypothetical protein